MSIILVNSCFIVSISAPASFPLRRSNSFLSSSSVAYWLKSLKIFLSSGPLSSQYLVKASPTVHGVGNGCFLFSSSPSAFLKTKLLSFTRLNLFTILSTSLSLFSGKTAKLAAVWYSIPVPSKSYIISKHDPYLLVCLNSLIEWILTSLPPTYCLMHNGWIGCSSFTSSGSPITSGYLTFGFLGFDEAFFFIPSTGPSFSQCSISAGHSLVFHVAKSVSRSFVASPVPSSNTLFPPIISNF
mmetsp:Transcript_20323/g.20013  ORF Transcript_20323/g.20013 Transcript_20323/m.20013 type:complete len:241 (-) Transcript_20323:571-1293(-)